MPKKILVIINGFDIGGTIVSLYSLLSVIDTNKIKVDIFSRSNTGIYKDKLPNCRILPENVWLSHSIYSLNYFSRVFCFLLLCIRKAFEKIGIDLYKLYNYIGGKQICSDNYDAVIGYDETLPRYICSLPARKRINWIHCDYRRHAKGKDESRYYDKIDVIVCVSNFVKDVFCNIYPQYTDKTVAIHNIINVEDIIEKSKEPINDSRFDSSVFTILSCGRLDPVKQFDKIPSIAEQIKEKTNQSFKWYIIGGGNDILAESIQQDLNSRNLKDIVIMLGQKSNPYPYMAKADLYVCTSYSESYPLAVNEAKALQTPVICNNFPSATESIADGDDGYIVTLKEMADLIVLMIKNNSNIKQRVSENDIILKSLYKIL